MPRARVPGDGDFVHDVEGKIRVDLGLYNALDLPFRETRAEVVELVDALASGASGRKPVGVRVPPSALTTRRLVPRYLRINVDAPRVDPTLQAAHVRKPRPAEQLERGQ